MGINTGNKDLDRLLSLQLIELASGKDPLGKLLSSTARIRESAFHDFSTYHYLISPDYTRKLKPYPGASYTVDGTNVPLGTLKEFDEFVSLFEPEIDRIIDEWLSAEDEKMPHFTRSTYDSAHPGPEYFYDAFDDLADKIRDSTKRGFRYRFAPDLYALFKEIAQRDSYADSVYGDDLPDSYAFEPFTENTVNFGLQIIYRQSWVPLGTQPGEIVRTLPLGPKQTEKVSFKVVRRTKATRQADISTSIETAAESSVATKDSSEVVQEAAEKYNWHVDASASYSGFGFNAEVKAGEGGENSSASKNTKSHLNDIMEKTASKIRKDTKIIVSTEIEETSEMNQASEITNPNDEMAVTYIYSRLQRQYELRTYLSEVNQVIFVAERIPAPSEITGPWIRRYDWIIAKELLDESFRSDLETVRTFEPENSRSVQSVGSAKLVTYQFVVSALQAVASWLKVGLFSLCGQDGRYDDNELLSVGQDSFWEKGLVNVMPKLKASFADQTAETNIKPGDGSDDIDPEISSLMQSISRKGIPDYKSLQGQIPDLFQSQQALYERELERKRAREANRAQYERSKNRLRAHIYDNILHYCRAIWSSEDSDARILRYQQIRIPIKWELAATSAGSLMLQGYFVPSVTNDDQDTMPLSELVNPAGPIGFAGNYAVFYLKQSVQWTSLLQMISIMEAPYLVYNVNIDASSLDKAITLRASVSDNIVGPCQLHCKYKNDGSRVPKLSVYELHGTTSVFVYDVLIKDEAVVEIPPENPQIRLWISGLDYFQNGDTFEIVITTQQSLEDPELKSIRWTIPPLADNEKANFFSPTVIREMREYFMDVFLAFEGSGTDISWAKSSVTQKDILVNRYHDYILRKRHTRRILLDTNNLLLTREVDSATSLEPFKGLHRLIDVLKANEEFNKITLENERKRARLDANKLGDPDIEKLTVVASVPGAAELAALDGLVSDEGGVDE